MNVVLKERRRPEEGESAEKLLKWRDVWFFVFVLIL